MAFLKVQSFFFFIFKHSALKKQNIVQLMQPFHLVAMATITRTELRPQAIKLVHFAKGNSPSPVFALGFLVNLGELAHQRVLKTSFFLHVIEQAVRIEKSTTGYIKEFGNIKAELKVVINLMVRLNLAFLGKYILYRDFQDLL